MLERLMALINDLDNPNSWQARRAARNKLANLVRHNPKVAAMLRGLRNLPELCGKPDVRANIDDALGPLGQLTDDQVKKRLKELHDEAKDTSLLQDLDLIYKLSDQIRQLEQELRNRGIDPGSVKW